MADRHPLAPGAGRFRQARTRAEQPAVELAYLAYVLRPRVFALSFLFRPEPGAPAPRFEVA